MHGNSFLGQQFLGQSSIDGVTYSVAGSLAGTGSIAGNVVYVRSGAGALAGTGSISGNAIVTRFAAGSLAGTGSISGNIVPAGVNGNFAGVGSIVGNAQLTGAIAGSLAGTGLISGAATVSRMLAGDLSGNGSMVGVVFATRSGSGALVGIGSIDASSLGILLQVSGSLIGVGNIIGYAKMWPAPSSASWIPGGGQAVVFISSAEGEDSLWIGDGMQESSVVPDGDTDPNWVVADKAGNGNFSKNVTGI